jgi:hypothetical protein
LGPSIGGDPPEVEFPVPEKYCAMRFGFASHHRGSGKESQTIGKYRLWQPLFCCGAKKSDCGAAASGAV